MHHTRPYVQAFLPFLRVLGISLHRESHLPLPRHESFRSIDGDRLELDALADGEIVLCEFGKGRFVHVEFVKCCARDMGSAYFEPRRDEVVELQYSE